MTSTRIATVPAPEIVPCVTHAWEAFLENLPTLLILGFITAAVLVAGNAMMEWRGIVGLLGIGFFVFIAKPLQWGFYHLCLLAARGHEVDPAELSRVRENYREVVIGNVLVWMLVAAGTLLLIVPGVIAYLRTRFVPYLIVEEGLPATAAIRESFQLTRSHQGTLFGLWIGGLAASFVGLLFFGIGIVPAAILWDLSNASLYHAEVAPPEDDEASRFLGSR